MGKSAKHHKKWGFWRRALYRLISSILPRFMRFYFTFEVKNSHILSQFPEGQAVIFCGNHSSHLDGPVLGASILEPFGRRRFLAVMGAGSAIKENPIFNLTPLIGAFPVYRKNPEPGFQYAINTLKEGMAVFITPQGRRIKRTPLHDYFQLLQEGKTGVGRIILRMNGKIPVIPFYMHGAGNALRPGSLIPKFKSYISVSFGEPLFFDHFTNSEGWDQKNSDFFVSSREITNEIMASIRKQLLEEEKYYFRYLEHKFGKSIDEIDIENYSGKKFLRFLHKLASIPPSQLKDKKILFRNTYK